MPKPRRRLTLDRIQASAAPYSRRSDWMRADRSAYLAAAKRGLLETVCAPMPPVPASQALSPEEIRASAAQYRSRVAWLRGDRDAYNAARRLGVFDDVCEYMPSSPRKRPLEALMASAAPYQSRSEWKQADPSAYGCAKQRGLLEVVCAHMTRKIFPPGYWTLERCQASAAGFSSRQAWLKGDALAYQAAYANGWKDACCARMPKHQRPASKWTPEQIAASAKQFSSKTTWYREQPGAYKAAKRLGLFDQVTAHMTGPSKQSAAHP